MKLSDFSTRAELVLQLGQKALASTQHGTYGTSWVADAPFAEFRSAALSFLIAVFGPDHPYSSDFNQRAKSALPSDVQAGIGILQAAKSEIDGGWLVAAKSLVTAEIFTDFLEMAEHLLESQYKDPAAVMNGSVLEEHLRQLCLKHSIPTQAPDGKGNLVPKKADTMNSELAAARVYNKLDQKNVTAWLDLRNKAAHGRYGEYSHEQVALMHQGVANFMARVPP